MSSELSSQSTFVCCHPAADRSYGLTDYYKYKLTTKEMVQLLYIIASLHVLLCPFTKVEESFNIQATHDILYHRHNLSQYDHNEFPGVVPRSFIGPLVISALSAPVVSIFHITGINKFWMQYVVRLTLALVIIGTWSRLRNTLQKLYGSTFTWWYTLITVTQYHIMFYMSRPLPNIVVLPLVLLAYEGWLSGKHKQFIISAGAAIIIFRSELAMLFGLFLIIDLYFQKINLKILFKVAVPAGLGLIALTVAVDSLFWGRFLWPEAEVFWYNTILNKSSDWGTSPFLWYFYSALPRGLGPSMFLIPAGLYLDKRMIQYAAPAFVYILLYSFLPHKELRFIIYVFPLLNMASAAACSFIYLRRNKSPVNELTFWGTILVIIGNIIMTLAFTLVAMTNYPGGVAITRFHKLLKDEQYVHVHICNLAAQTGVTRYTQFQDGWRYSKNESLQPEQLQEYTHLLIEAKSKYSPNLKSFTQTHVILDSVESFSQVAMNYKFVPPFRIKTKPSIFILERKDFRDAPRRHKTFDSFADVISDVSDEMRVVNYEDLSEKQANSEVLNNQDKQENMEEPEIIEDSIENNEQKTELSNEELFEKETIFGGEEITQPVSEEEKTEKLSKEDKKLFKDNDETMAAQKLQKGKKAIDELKALRKERKKKAIEKIKLETRKEVVASAKEKLKEIMKRHKHIAEELSDHFISDVSVELEGKDGTPSLPSNLGELESKDDRGDIPDAELNEPQKTEEIISPEIKTSSETDVRIDIPDTTKISNENVDTIVEEVIVRLIERKIYDDKTKPEDIKAEDRLMIQKIVEEVLAEKTNYVNVDKK